MSYIITMKDFLQNPTGKSSASFANRSVIIANLDLRFNKLYEKCQFEFKSYKSKGSFIVHCKVPSERFHNDLKYDVVLQFIPIGNSGSNMTINDFAMKMFSNSPAFVYTYAYVFNQDKNIPKDLLCKLDKKSLTDIPKIKNPFETYGFEKSIYFTLSYIKLKGINKLSYMNSSPEIKSIKKEIVDKVASSEDTLKRYKFLEKRELERKKNEKLKKTKKIIEQRTTKQPIRKKEKTKNIISNKRITKKPIKSTTLKNKRKR